MTEYLSTRDALDMEGSYEKLFYLKLHELSKKIAKERNQKLEMDEICVEMEDVRQAGEILINSMDNNKPSWDLFYLKAKT